MEASSSPSPSPQPVEQVQLISRPNRIIRVGAEYQAVVPESCSTRPAPDNYSPVAEACLLWTPHHPNLTEDDIDSFIELATGTYEYELEQALAVLTYEKFDLQKALTDLPEFIPRAELDEFCADEKILFADAYSLHKRNFHQYEKVFPEKKISELVFYYYTSFKIELMRAKDDTKHQKQQHRLPN